MLPPSDLPPFPADVPLAPIARISAADLLSSDPFAIVAVLTACQTHGFFYLDLSTAPDGQALLSEATQLQSLAGIAFDIPLEEKMSHHLQKGVSMFGYKAAGTVKQTDKDLRPDLTEFYNIGKDHLHGIVPSRSYPAAVDDARPLLKSFTRHAHETGMLVLRTLATAMGLPENTFADLNEFSKPAGDHCRLTYKPADSNAAAAAKAAVGLPSHTDFGSVTILFNWLGGLQIESQLDSSWVYVKPVPGCAVVNLGDAMVKFTNGALKSAKHRVVDAPGEQAKYDRVSVVYFVRPCNESLMKPVDGFADIHNGKYVKVGGKVSVGDDDTKVYTAGEWMIKRAIQMGS